MTYRGLKDFEKCPTLQKMTDYFEMYPVKRKLHMYQKCVVNCIKLFSERKERKAYYNMNICNYNYRL